MKITDFKCIDSGGQLLSSDAFGNNAAVSCPHCSYPILFVALNNQKGSAESHKTKCKGCGTDFFMEIEELNKIIIIKH